MKYLTGIGLCIAIGGAGVALAQAGPGGQPTTRAEAKARADAMFDAMDHNKDGFVAADELPHMRHGMGGMGRPGGWRSAERGPGMGANMRPSMRGLGGMAGPAMGPDWQPGMGPDWRPGPGPGTMPPPPPPMPDKAALDGMFAQIDSNHDGQINRAEFDAFHAAMATAMRTERPMGPGAGGPPPPPGGMGPGGMPRRWEDRPPMGGPGAMNRPMGGPGRMGGMMIDRLDTNHDGKISRAEMEAAALARFDAADTNHDGTLSDAERQAARPQRRMGPGAMPPPGAPAKG